MALTNRKFMIRYILLKVFLEEWKLGDKIYSVQQFIIALNIPMSTVKATLQHLVKIGILTSKEKQGYFVNDDLFNVLPLSIRKRYGMIFKDTDLKKYKGDNNKIFKEYSFKDEIVAYVETKVSSNLFRSYNLKKTFMYNLAFNGVIISRINSNFSFINKNGQNWVLEERTMFDLDSDAEIFENIYIRADHWKEKRNTIII